MNSTPSNLPGIELAPSVWTDREQLHFAFSRSSGPGGQNVNKVNTKTELRISPDALHGLSERARHRLRTIAANKITAEGEILITADTERTQDANRHACMKKLRTLIVTAQVEPKIRRKTKPSRASKKRRLDSKRVHSDKKQLRSKIHAD